MGGIQDVAARFSLGEPQRRLLLPELHQLDWVARGVDRGRYINRLLLMRHNYADVVEGNINTLVLPV